MQRPGNPRPGPCRPQPAQRFFVNLEYTLPNGTAVKLLEDDKVYLGNQIEQADSQRCYGIVGDESHILVCEYGCGGADPEILLYKKR